MSDGKLKTMFGLVLVSGFFFASLSQAEEPKPAEGKFIAHEWGTFTTLHWPSGSGLAWYQDTLNRPESTLPAFVETRMPGMKSTAFGLTTARMETPVIYFYSDRERPVSVMAKFPGGAITEVFPRCIRFQGGWQLDVIPLKKDDAPKFPIDPKRPENHYYEARNVPGAAMVRRKMEPDKDGKPQPDQVEKFIFYRGVGSFETQLRASLKPGGDEMTVAYFNMQHGLQNVWAVSSSAEAIRWEKIGAFKKWEPSKPEQRKPRTEKLTISKMNDHASREKSIVALTASMIEGLVKAGLTQDEAAAMIATWDEQWYEEPGQRLFTIPSQAMIDRALPLAISPKPQETVRVFVHRQELLSHETVGKIERSLLSDTSRAEAHEIIAGEKLGRFVHGTIGAVADDIARRERNAHFERGMAALKFEAPKTASASSDID